MKGKQNRHNPHKHEAKRADGKLFVSSQGLARTQSPHYQKLRTRVTHVWGHSGGQPSRSAMERPRPGRTFFL